MIRGAALMLAAFAGLAACVPAERVAVPAGDRAATCVALFQEFDRLETFHGSGQPRRDGRIAPPVLLSQGQRLRNAGCITRDADLAGRDALPVVAWAEAGAPIAPIALHAGVVQSNAMDATMRAFFEARGIGARSVGSAVLGRRVYLGPFSTQGGLEAAAALARQAGFIAPYPARF
jgi:hypothetical protein